MKHTLLLTTIIAMLAILTVGLGIHLREIKSSIESQPKVVQPPAAQPVYLMVRCPKGGGDVVFNITDDLKLKHLNP